jgi:hypothetical protein
MCCQEEMLEVLNNYKRTKNMVQLKQSGLKPWWPLWADLLYVHFLNCITPDLLHQLHKGLFKTHLLDLVDKLMDEGKMDVCFQAMPCVQGL